MKSGYKLFIVRTYVRAKNASDAIRKVKGLPPDDVYVADDWKEGKLTQLAEAIGFDDGITPEEDEE